MFEVVSEVGSGAVDFWCADGDYARLVLGAGPTDPVYVVGAYGSSATRPGHDAVRFSLSNPGTGGDDSYFDIRVTRIGEALMAGYAQTHCRNADQDIY